MVKNWIIEGESMKVQAGSVSGRSQEGDVLFGTKKFGNFILSIDWKISTAENSGIFYNIVEYSGRLIYIVAPEVQVLDNWNARRQKVGKSSCRIALRYASRLTFKRKTGGRVEQHSDNS